MRSVWQRLAVSRRPVLHIVFPINWPVVNPSRVTWSTPVNHASVQVSSNPSRTSLRAVGDVRLGRRSPRAERASPRLTRSLHRRAAALLALLTHLWGAAGLPVGTAPAPCGRPSGRRRRPSYPHWRARPAGSATPARARWPAPPGCWGAQLPVHFRRGVGSRASGALPTCAPGVWRRRTGHRQPARQSRPPRRRRLAPPPPPMRRPPPPPPPRPGRPALHPPSWPPPPSTCTTP